MTGVSDDFTWAGRLVGGSVVRAERQGARRHGGRPAWYVDVERDGQRIGCYAGMQRPQNNDAGRLAPRSSSCSCSPRPA